MLWFKALHIIFVAAWFAGLFYLPRIFVNLAMEHDATARARLLLMARKLNRFTHWLSVPALGFGLVLWVHYGIGWYGPGNGWMHAKLSLVVAAIAYMHLCARMLGKIESGRDQRSHVWYRWFNELPILLFAGSVILVVLKPF